ncbi:MAG: DUF5050 domain-containing protein [Firmicutes bacterium]|nr:DUF5050 domain-containing protein [Bacillota bacterium]
MIKKIICLFFIVLLFSSCANETRGLLDEQFDTEVYLADYDAKNGFLNGDAGMDRYGSVYYYSFMYGSPWIYYYDAASGVGGKLCGKPECVHMDQDCNAYHIDGDFCIYDGQLYYTEGSLMGKYLYRMDLTGSQREKVQSGIHSDIFIHRGYIFSSETQEVTKKGEASQIYTLYQDVLGQEGQSKVILEVQASVVSKVFYQVQGNKVYIMPISRSSEERTADIYEYNITTQKIKKLYSWKSNETPSGFVLEEDGLRILTGEKNRETEIRTVRLYKFYFEDGTMSEAQLVAEADGSLSSRLGQNHALVFVSAGYQVKESTFIAESFAGDEVYNGTLTSTVGQELWNVIHMGGDETGEYFTYSETSSVETSNFQLYRWSSEKGVEILG